MNHQIMGVVNITPNSFSDGDQFNSPSNCLKRIQYLQENQVQIFDLGAESTAPFNQAIVGEEEIARFEQIFFPIFEQIKFTTKSILSIDTYRMETFAHVYDFLQSRNFPGKVVWNDVSGVYDQELFTFLQRRVPQAFYIFSHTGVSQRCLANEHMQYMVSETGEKLLEQVEANFSHFLQQSEHFNLAKKIWLDPCFGFSKNADQNYFLMQHIDRLCRRFSAYPFVLGISRKSFLKQLIEGGKTYLDASAQVEILGGMLTFNWMREMPSLNIIHRLHEPTIFSLASKIFKQLH